MPIEDDVDGENAYFDFDDDGDGDDLAAENPAVNVAEIGLHAVNVGQLRRSSRIEAEKVRRVAQQAAAAQQAAGIGLGRAGRGRGRAGHGRGRAGHERAAAGGGGRAFDVEIEVQLFKSKLSTKLTS